MNEVTVLFKTLQVCMVKLEDSLKKSSMTFGERVDEELKCTLARIMNEGGAGVT